MVLSVAGISDQVPFMQRSVEEAGKGSAFITMTATPSVPADSLVHWYLDTGRLVPLDIAIIEPEGEFRELTLYLLNDVLAPDGKEVDLPPAIPGVPIFDLNQWRPRRVRLDEKGEMSVSLIEMGLLVVWGDKGKVTRRIAAGPLHFLLSETLDVQGCFLPQLDAVTLELLRYAGLVAGAPVLRHDEPTSEESIQISTITVTTTFTYQ